MKGGDSQQPQEGPSTLSPLKPRAEQGKSSVGNKESRQYQTQREEARSEGDQRMDEGYSETNAFEGLWLHRADGTCWLISLNHYSCTGCVLG